MKIILFGYGKMGKEIERLALNRNHEIILKVGRENRQQVQSELLKSADMAIEFTEPSSAFSNVEICANVGLNVVCGTTGWNQDLEKARQLCLEKKSGFFYASNFSIGMNIFFEYNKKLAETMKGFPEYDVSIEEIHHSKKLDSPSGTAITLAEGILNKSNIKNSWKNQLSNSAAEINAILKPNEMQIKSRREGEVTGIHEVKYQSAFESISFRHEAFSREVFAQGVLMAAEWMIGKKGNFGMTDLLK